MSYIYGLLQSFIAFLLNTADKYVGKFGLSIIVVTIIIRLEEVELRQSEIQQVQ